MQRVALGPQVTPHIHLGALQYNSDSPHIAPWRTWHNITAVCNRVALMLLEGTLGS